MQKKEDGEEGESSCLLVAIDSGVSRRPPKMKVDQDRRLYSKTMELLLHDEETAANLLREISFGFLGPPFENEPTPESTGVDHQKVTKAFQRGLVKAIRDMQVLRMVLVKLYRTLDHLLREFMAYVSSQSQKQETEVVINNLSSVADTQPSGVESRSNQETLPSGSESTPTRVRSPSFPKLKISPGSQRKSPGSSPRLNSPNRVSPLRENWHGKGSPGRMTIKLKDVSKSAKVCLSFTTFEINVNHRK